MPVAAVPAPTVPTVPAPQILAPAVPAAPVKQLTPKAGAGVTYEMMVTAGWTDEKMIADGYLTIA